MVAGSNFIERMKKIKEFIMISCRKLKITDEYRIISNGEEYRVEVKRTEFGFFESFFWWRRGWVLVYDFYYPNDSKVNFIVKFDSEEKTKENIAKWKSWALKNSEPSKKWKVV